MDHRYNHVPGFRAEIEPMLIKWRTLHNKRQTFQQQVKQHLETPTDEFERMMNEDLNRQLEALEIEEEKEYQRLKLSMEEELKKQRSVHESWTLWEELKCLEEEEKKQRRAKKYQQSHKLAQLKAKKMLHLLESYVRSKTYRLQRKL